MKCCHSLLLPLTLFLVSEAWLQSCPDPLDYDNCFAKYMMIQQGNTDKIDILSGPQSGACYNPKIEIYINSVTRPNLQENLQENQLISINYKRDDEPSISVIYTPMVSKLDNSFSHCTVDQCFWNKTKIISSDLVSDISDHYRSISTKIQITFDTINGFKQNNKISKNGFWYLYCNDNLETKPRTNVFMHRSNTQSKRSLLSTMSTTTPNSTQATEHSTGLSTSLSSTLLTDSNTIKPTNTQITQILTSVSNTLTSKLSNTLSTVAVYISSKTSVDINAFEVDEIDPMHYSTPSPTNTLINSDMKQSNNKFDQFLLIFTIFLIIFVIMFIVIIIWCVRDCYQKYLKQKQQEKYEKNHLDNVLSINITPGNQNCIIKLSAGSTAAVSPETCQTNININNTKYSTDIMESDDLYEKPRIETLENNIWYNGERKNSNINIINIKNNNNKNNNTRETSCHEMKNDDIYDKGDNFGETVNTGTRLSSIGERESVAHAIQLFDTPVTPITPV